MTSLSLYQERLALDIAFPSFEALFGFMGSRDEKFDLVLDEYQDTRKQEKENVDAMFMNASS